MVIIIIIIIMAELVIIITIMGSVIIIIMEFVIIIIMEFTIILTMDILWENISLVTITSDFTPDTTTISATFTTTKEDLYGFTTPLAFMEPMGAVVSGRFMFNVNMLRLIYHRQPLPLYNQENLPHSPTLMYNREDLPHSPTLMYN